MNELSTQPFLVLFGGISEVRTMNEKVYGDVWKFTFSLSPTEKPTPLCEAYINGMGVFDGINDVVVIDVSTTALGKSTNSSLGPGAKIYVPTFTIEAWVLIERFDSSWQSIFSIGSDITVQRFSSSNTISAIVCGLQVRGKKNIYDALWHHIALVVGKTTGEPEVVLYVDEDLDAQSLFKPAYMNSYSRKSVFKIGYGASMLNSYLNGMLDDVRLWSVARSKADIISGMFGVPDTSPGLEGWWQLDRANSEGIIKDFSVGSA